MLVRNFRKLAIFIERISELMRRGFFALEGLIILNEGFGVSFRNNLLVDFYR